METARVRWRVGWGLRLFAAIGLGAMLVIGGRLACSGERIQDRIGGVAFLVVFPIAGWLFYVRPYVELSSSFLTVRNPLRARDLRLVDVRSAEPLSTGLAIGLSDGSRVVAWALQQGVIESPRVSQARRLILDAARTASGG